VFAVLTEVFEVTPFFANMNLCFNSLAQQGALI
jgi:hypothetical protein